MTNDGPRPLDFGQGHWFEHLDASRKFLWNADDLPRLNQLLALRPGLQVADFGCGWGYLGHLLMPSISPGGRVDGFDLHGSLLEKGRGRAKEAGLQRRLRFTEADITSLDDVEDEHYDLAICQTVLMHLSRPQEAVAEMKRVVKPGGRVAAIEPDLYAASQSLVDCVGEDDLEWLRLHAAVNLHVMKGCRASGAGDYRVGARLPALFSEAGLEDVQLWLNPRPHHCSPPYAGDQSDYVDFLKDALAPENQEAEQATWRGLFDAGGGEPELWQAWKQRDNALQDERRRRLAAGTHRRTGFNALYLCVASVGEQ